jgi:anti-sigma factor RsiW
MNDKPLHCASYHCLDEQLLLYADGELPLLDSVRIRAHLAVCSECSVRMAKIESALSGLAQLSLQSHEPAMDASGPRALLKARLAELGRGSHTGPRRQLRYARGLAYACALILLVATGVAVLRHQTAARPGGYSRLLPDPAFTPGATREVSLADLCSAEDDDVVRSVPAPLQRRILEEYGIRDIPATEFEVDYLITPGLGGSEDVRNLWPQPHFNTTWNSYVKDQLEDRLHHMVCERKIPLSEAQREISSNWIAAYKKYFRTEQPLATGSLSKISEISYPSDARPILLLLIGGL